MKQTTKHLPKQIAQYADAFFEALSVKTDQRDGHHYITYLWEAVKRFCDTEAKERAYDVYRVFLECYGYPAKGERLNFIQFLEKMRGYEENAAVLTEKQRDHFIHSVNVFVLGLAVYQSNAAYRKAFHRTCFAAEKYSGRRQTAIEEFFFRWGMAALCHDIGYPIEIITNQVNDFINFTARLMPEDPRIHARVEYDRFDLINAIPEMVRKRDFISDYYSRHEECVYIDLLKPVDLLAYHLHKTLKVDLCAVKERLDGYVAESGRSGRVDHGFFSALILLKWYGYLIQVSARSPSELFVPLLDIASAVLLHNFYSIALVANTKHPNEFGLGPLTVDKHPLAYLLMLCDELQEWNRPPYGRADKLRIGIESADVTLYRNRLVVTYIVSKGTMPEEFIGNKMGTLNTLLHLADVFPEGVSIGLDDFAEMPPPPSDVRLSVMQLEKLAIAIHNRYNAIAQQLDVGKVVEFPNFADLPGSKKYYNFRSAMEYPDMLSKIGCELRLLDSEDKGIVAFTEDEVEILAACEHERWMRGRVERGWHYGEKRNADEKTNPYMVPYADLPEKIKEYDRAPARGIPALVETIGLGVYRRAPAVMDHFAPEEIERLAERIHDVYNERARSDSSAKLLTFAELSDEKRESNRRQARGIPNKLRHAGLRLAPIGTPGLGEPIAAFPLDTVEMLARIEHDEWMGEKIKNGWRFGPRDEADKRNPYIVAYDSLEEQVKEYDRDTARRIPELVKACGYAIFPEAKASAT